MWKGKEENGRLVLLVDDDRSVRESLSDLLAVEGYSVLEAENGSTALALLKSAPHYPFVILLDLVMPVMDGDRFLELRAEDPMLSRIPVVVISGNVFLGMCHPENSMERTPICVSLWTLIACLRRSPPPAVSRPAPRSRLSSRHQ
jgi:CheY-like chemotaxis protein